MINDFGIEPVESPRGKIGLPMALTTFELFPLYSKLITELGYEVVLSKPSPEGNNRATSSICYPAEIVHGAIYDLEQRGVDYILLPPMIDIAYNDGYIHGFTCPTTASIADIIRATFNPIADKILEPTIILVPDHIGVTMKEIERIGKLLGVKKKKARQAGERALAHYQEFRTGRDTIGWKALEELKNEPTVIIAGRPYTTCSWEVNLSLPRKIISRGYNAISSDLLPLMDSTVHPRNVWKFTQQIMNAVAYVKKFPNMHICLISCFSCGPDSVLYHYVRQELAGQTFCYLEIDSHTAHAGFETRVGAFLDIIEARQRKLDVEARDESRVGG